MLHTFELKVNQICCYCPLNPVLQKLVCSGPLVWAQEVCSSVLVGRRLLWPVCSGDWKHSRIYLYDFRGGVHNGYNSVGCGSLCSNDRSNGLCNFSLLVGNVYSIEKNQQNEYCGFYQSGWIKELHLKRICHIIYVNKLSKNFRRTTWAPYSQRQKPVKERFSALRSFWRVKVSFHNPADSCLPDSCMDENRY